MSLRGTVLWYDGVRHVFNQVGLQRGEGAVPICVNLVDTKGKDWPPAFALGVKEAGQSIIDNPSILDKPSKTVKRR